jgi:hypothetical protein
MTLLSMKTGRFIQEEEEEEEERETGQKERNGK